MLDYLNGLFDGLTNGGSGLWTVVVALLIILLIVAILRVSKR